MKIFTKISLPEVERIHGMLDSIIVPPLEDGWSDHMKLAWHAAVVSYETGLKIRVLQNSMSGHYFLEIGRSSIGGLDFHRSWDYLNGAMIGAGEWQRERVKQISAKRLRY